MRIRDICKNLKEPIVFKAKPCPLEMPGCFGKLYDKNIGNAFENGYLVIETRIPYESRACSVDGECSENGECPYVNAVGRLVIINPKMIESEGYVGEANVFPLKEGRPCSPSVRP